MPKNKPNPRAKRSGRSAQSRSDGRAARRRTSGSRSNGRNVRLRPERREQVDHSTIALCYWLLAQRIVKEAEDNGDLNCPDPESHEGEAGAKQ